MQAIIIKEYGGVDGLGLAERPMPVPGSDQVLIEVKAFGINHAEIYFRQGVWGEVAEISGIECVGLVKSDPSGTFTPGQKVVAIVGGMGRSINGSYAEYTVVPVSNVASIASKLPWETLAAIPESYATAWTCLFGNLALQPGQTLLIRGATSALGQAAINLAAHHEARVIATTRNRQRSAGLRAMGAAEVLLESANLSVEVRASYSTGIDAVLDLIGSSTVLDSLAMLRRDGRVCQAGFLGGGAPMSEFNPVFQIPSGRHWSVLATALVTGTEGFPIKEIPFQEFVDRVADGSYHAGPAHVFAFDQIRAAHRLVEEGKARGKVVVRL